MALTYIQKTVHPAPITLRESNGVAYFTFPLLEQTRMVRHAFSTRLGGASKGYFSTMNFSLTRGDNRDDVLENYRKMARILGTDVSKMVLRIAVLLRKRTLEKESGGNAIMKTSTGLSQTCRG